MSAEELLESYRFLVDQVSVLQDELVRAHVIRREAQEQRDRAVAMEAELRRENERLRDLLAKRKPRKKPEPST